MSDLINRHAAIDAICTEGTRLERNGTVAMVEIKQWCVDILEALPSADRPTGEWIPHKSVFGGLGEKVYTCNRCGYNVGFHTENFCPNFGAKMEGADDE